MTPASRWWPRGPSSTPSSARRCWPAGIERSTYGPLHGWWRSPHLGKPGLTNLANHDVVVLAVGPHLKRPGAVDLEAALGVKALCALVSLVDTQPHAAHTPFFGGSQREVHQRLRHTGAVVVGQHIYLRQLGGVVGDTANEHGITDDSAVLLCGEDRTPRIAQILREALGRQVGVDERRDVLGCRRGRTGQRKGQRGDGRQLVNIDRARRDGVYGRRLGSQRFHCARW